jgi:TctA family transporter
LVLGPMLEDNFRRALSIQHGTLSGFFTSPIAAAAYFLIAAIVVVKAVAAARQFLKARQNGTPGQKDGEQVDDLEPRVEPSQRGRGG